MSTARIQFKLLGTLIAALPLILTATVFAQQTPPMGVSKKRFIDLLEMGAHVRWVNQQIEVANDAVATHQVTGRGEDFILLRSPKGHSMAIPLNAIRAIIWSPTHSPQQNDTTPLQTQPANNAQPKPAQPPAKLSELQLKAEILASQSDLKTAATQLARQNLVTKTLEKEVLQSVKLIGSQSRSAKVLEEAVEKGEPLQLGSRTFTIEDMRKDLANRRQRLQLLERQLEVVRASHEAARAETAKQAADLNRIQSRLAELQSESAKRAKGAQQ